MPRRALALAITLADPPPIAVLIVFNPAAGRRQSALLWRVLDVMAANGVRLELTETKGQGDAERFARAGAAAGAKLVVAAGGDGTIAEVANGLIGSDAALGIIPLGTANVLARELRLPFAPRAVAAALAFRRTRRHWPGLARSPAGERLFVQMLGVGFDAHVVHRLSPALKRTFGRSAYALQTLREMPRYGFGPIRVRVDGRDMEAGSVIVSKGRLYAGPYLLAPEARPEEPGFSVVLFERSGPVAALRYGAALAFDRLARSNHIRRIRATEVEFLGSVPVAAQTDGDSAGYAPMAVTDASGPLRIVTE